MDTTKEKYASNVWRVLKGPNNDWPLALCDYQTIDSVTDVLPNDVLYRAYVGENDLLQKDSRHAWYYLSDQTVEDLIVFRNTDSKGMRPRKIDTNFKWPFPSLLVLTLGSLGGFHAAFDTKINSSPRESIEVRVAAFR